MAGPDRYIDHGSLDACLIDIADNGNQLHLVSQSPENYGEVTAYSLGFVALNPGIGNGAYTLDDGVVSGRRLTLAQQVVPGTANGTATHRVIIDTVNEVIKAITTVPNYSMLLGVNQAVPEHDPGEIKDPA